MTREQALAALLQRTDAIKALGATSLYLYGSTGRDQAGAASDIDLFIDYDPGSGFSLVELVGIKQFLEHDLRMVVDLTTRDSLAPLLKARIEASAERVF